MTDNNSGPAVERGEPESEQVEWSADVLPSIAVVEAVARVRDCDPTDMESLDKVVDTDALDALFTPRYDGTERDQGSVSFPYEDRHVTVYSDGRVVVEER